MKRKESYWWRNFFPAFRPVFDSIPAKETAELARYVIRKLNLKTGSKFLDCPCGIGRISVPLAQKGIKVTGVDFTPSYLEELKEISRRRKVKIDLHCRDMRKIKFQNQFDAAGILGNSLGYTEKESDDIRVIKNMYRALKPGGRLIIHLVNRDWIIATFSPDGWRQIGSLRILEQRTFDYRHSRSLNVWYFIRDGAESQYDVKVRVYSFHELVKILENVGFKDIQGYGTTKDDPIGPNYRMMYIIGTKPKK